MLHRKQIRNVLIIFSAMFVTACGAENQGGDHEFQVYAENHGDGDYFAIVSINGQSGTHRLEAERNGSNAQGTRYAVVAEVPSDLNGDGTAKLVKSVHGLDHIIGTWACTAENGTVTLGQRQ